METVARGRYGSRAAAPRVRPSELLALARRAPPDGAGRVLLAAAAFDAVVRAPLVLVGGAAQMIHTGLERPTDIDMVGPLDSRDREALANEGFVRDGRHWVWGSGDHEIAIEVPDSTLFGEDPPELVDVEGRVVQVISVNDLLLDRLIQATDGSVVTWEEALSLAIAAQDRIDWTLIQTRCRDAQADDLMLRNLPVVLDRLMQSIS